MHGDVNYNLNDYALCKIRASNEYYHLQILQACRLHIVRMLVWIIYISFFNQSKLKEKKNKVQEVSAVTGFIFNQVTSNLFLITIYSPLSNDDKSNTRGKQISPPRDLMNDIICLAETPGWVLFLNCLKKILLSLRVSLHGYNMGDNYE